MSLGRRSRSKDWNKHHHHHHLSLSLSLYLSLSISLSLSLSRSLARSPPLTSFFPVQVNKSVTLNEDWPTGCWYLTLSQPQKVISGQDTSQQNKISSICLNSLSDKIPSVSFRSNTTTHSNQKITFCIRHRTFITPRGNTKLFGERSFSYTLPRILRHSHSSSSPKTALKTHLFKDCF